MNNQRSGFALIEAIVAIVIVTIGLAFIAQSLLTNFHTGLRFQETIRSLIVMENRLGVLCVTGASDDLLDASAQPLDKPYERFTISTQSEAVNDHLKKIGLTLNWPQGSTQGSLDITTIVYNPNAS